MRTLLAPDCRPIIIADAGFRNPWFAQVHKLGWDYLGRLTRRVCIQLPKESCWYIASDLYPRAIRRALDFGLCAVGKSRIISWHRVILGKKFRRNPLRSPRKRRRTDRGRGNARARRRAQEPWLLATSLAEVSALTICHYYAKRMQIEETFRDAKNHRFGWSLSEAQSRSDKRWAVLLLIAALAMLVVTVVG